MRKWVIVVAVGLCLTVFGVCAEEGGKVAEKPGAAAEKAPLKHVEPLLQPAQPLGDAKVLDSGELLRFVPKSPKGWTASKPISSTQRMGPFAVTKIRQTFTRGTERIELILDDLGTNNPYFAMKEPYKVKEQKTADGYMKRLMLGKLAAQEIYDAKNKMGSVFFVFEKRIQLNVMGSGIGDNSVVVRLAKDINLKELKKVMEEKSK